jgi:SAM-dependent methyltransferase
VGIDFSATMVERARQLHPDVEFRVGDAEELPFADASFDAVVMNFGLLHLARPERAIAEARRVLRTGGRFAFTVWCGPEEAIGFGIILRAIEAHGSVDVGLPSGPPFFRFSDPRESIDTLAAAGFGAPHARQIPLLWRLPSPASLFERIWWGTVRTAGLLRAQPPAALAAIADQVAAEARSYRRGAVIELPMPALLASAVKE